MGRSTDLRRKQMQNKKKRGSVVRRALIKFRRSGVAEALLVVILAIGVLCIVIPFVPEEQEEVREENIAETVKAPKPLVIDIPEKCTTGIVTVYSGDQKLYEYSGKIVVGNDGSNGEPVEVTIEYPEGTWPCRCYGESEQEVR